MHELPSVIEAELEAAKAFLSLLNEENFALVEGNTERLSVVVQTKSEHLKEIAHLSQQRNQLRPLAEIPAWLENHPDSRKSWQELILLAEKIKQLNELNGKLIDVRLRGTQQALGMLHSLSRTATSLYGPDGQASLGISPNRYSRENA